MNKKYNKIMKKYMIEPKKDKKSKRGKRTMEQIKNK